MDRAADRRQHARYAADLACKILRPATARFMGARTTDVSAGGALLEVDTIRPLNEGEEIEVGVCWRDQPVLTGRDLCAARVMRAGPMLDGRQRIAVRFARIQGEAELLPAAVAA